MKFAPTLHRLSNGIAVLLDPMDIETASMEIFVKGGGRVEKPAEYGIAHFLEHMILSGSGKYPSAKAVKDFLNDNGGTRDGLTGMDRTAYYGRILSENFHALLDVLTDAVQNPLIAPETMEGERGVIMQEMKRYEDNQNRQFDWLVRKNLFAGSYLARYNTVGNAETINSFARADLVGYKNERYTAENIIIGISGKFPGADVVLTDLEKSFGGIPRGNGCDAPAPEITPSIVYDVRPDRRQTKLFIGFGALYPDERKYDFELACVEIFGLALSRRLYEDVRYDRGLVYAFGADGYGDRYAEVNGFSTALSPEKLGDLIAAVARGCYDMAHRNPITGDELNRRRAMIKLNMADFYESSERRLGRMLDFYADFGELYDPAWFDALRARMTPDDVMKHSAGYFSKPLNIVAEGPPCDIDPAAVWKDNYK